MLRCNLDRVTFVQTLISSDWEVVNLTLCLAACGVEISLQTLTFVSHKHTGFEECRNDLGRDLLLISRVFEKKAVIY